MKREPSVLSICVGKPETVDWDGTMVDTAIFKHPVNGKVKVGRLNLEGDEQADLTVHGGEDKAVYAYPTEQYAYWRNELPDRDWTWGNFGENLTTEGFDEDSLCIGDRLKIGTAIFEVTQPRMPCFKLGIRLDDASMIKRFYKSGKWGYYLAVRQEGVIETGDEIIRDGREGDFVTLSEVSQCFIDPNVDSAIVSKVLNSRLAKQMKYQLKSRFGL